MPPAVWIRRLALTGLLLCLVVVVLGAYVRLTAAGLGCPDWPGCYGRPTPLGIAQDAAAQAAFPTSAPDAGKAWREMIHRYAAGTLGLIIVAIAALAIATRSRRVIGIGYACAPAPLIDAMMRIHQYGILCAPIISQEAALEALLS